MLLWSLIPAKITDLIRIY